jgi:hypothetical protein
MPWPCFGDKLFRACEKESYATPNYFHFDAFLFIFNLVEQFLTMGNIDFSKVGRAILENKVLADYISRRLANVTPEENAAGKIEIKLVGGKSFILRFGPPSRLA